MKFRDLFKKRTNPEMQECLDMHKKTNINKIENADRIIEKMEQVKKDFDRRFHIEPVEFDRRKANA